MIKRIKKKPILISTAIFFILLLVAFICLIYTILRVANIENLLRYLISVVLLLVSFLYLLSFCKLTYKPKNISVILFDLFLVISFVGVFYVCGVINGLYKAVSSISKDVYTYSSSIITMTDSDIKSTSDLKDIKIGIIKEEIDSDAYETNKEILNKNNLNDNEIIEYESNGDIINALYEDEINAALLPTSYVSLFVTNTDYENISNETKILFSYEKEFKKVKITTTKSSKDPITVLLLGMDSTESDISKVTSFNADTIMLVTFNPQTKKATVLSVPRDTYVPIMCLTNHVESKITHSGWGNVDCVSSTLENLTGIDIDYYVKVNFTALVKLVDQIGGIEVDVPYSFCEQDSQRRWDSYTVYVEEGLQTLNGEQALALSRNRHPNSYCSSKWTNYYSDDMVRGQNQQKVLNALINKIANNLDLNSVTEIINIIGSNVDTNMSIDEITSYYSVIKDIALSKKDGDVIDFERLSLSTYGKYMYDPALKRSGMSMQIYYKGSLEDIVKEMKINLGLESPTFIKTFTYSYDEEYEEEIVGTGDYDATIYNLVPSFVDDDIETAKAWAKKYNIAVNIEYEETTEGVNNTIISQDVPYSYRVDKISSITFTVRKVETKKKTTDVDEDDEDDVDDKKKSEENEEVKESEESEKTEENEKTNDEEKVD